MLSYEEARERLGALRVPARTETVELARASGRVAAEDVRLDRDQPGFDRATMDGFALRLAEGVERYRVVGTVFAGQTFEGELEPGQAVRIMTGAPCPRDVTVVPIELTDVPRGETGPIEEVGVEEVGVTDASALAPGRNIAWRGEDGHAGDVVVRAGTRLSPAILSAAAMAGASRVSAYVPPRLAVVTTGDEVGGEGEAAIRDSNGPLLASLARALGCPYTRAHALDDEAGLAGRLTAAAAEADVVVTVGGVSMGAKDFVPDAARALGFVEVFHKVAIQPGKPIFVAQHADGRLFLGLPGNPVSVLATAHLFLAPAVGLWLGGWSPRWLPLPLARDFEPKGKRRLFLPARLEEGGVEPVRWNGSGDLLAAATGDGLADLSAGEPLAAGRPVPFLPFLGHVPGDRAVLPPRAAR